VSVKAVNGSVVVYRRVRVSVRGLNRSVVVCRGVGGLRKGSKKTSEVLKEGIVRIEVRGLRMGGFRKGLYLRL